MAADTAQSVMRTYLSVVGLFNLSASLIWGINTLFLLEAGLTLTQTFIANAFYSLGMVLFEIPTGVVADTLGRRTSFLASLVVLFFATLAYVTLYWLHADILWWAIASVALGLGFTFYSGAVEAWVVDAMDSVGYDGPMEKVFARGGQMFGASMLVGTFGGGLLGEIDLAIPYVLRAVLIVACFVVASIWMHDLGFQRRTFRVGQVPKEMRDVARTSFTDGLKRPAVRWLLLAGVVHWTFLIWGWYAWQPHFVALAGGMIWVAGAVAAAVSVTMIVGNGLAARISAWAGDRAAVMIAADAIMVLGLVGVAVSGSFWPAVLSFLAAMVAFGIHEPVRSAMLHTLLSSRARATVISFGGLLGSAGGVVSQIALADYAEGAGIPAGYLVGAAWGLVSIPFAILAARAAPQACDPGHGDGPPGPVDPIDVTAAGDAVEAAAT